MGGCCTFWAVLPPRPPEGGLPEKVPQKGVPLILGTFWRFWGFPGENGVPDSLSENPSQQRKRYTTPQGSSQKVLPRVNFALPACPRPPKLTFGRTSDMTPEGWCTVFSAGLDSLRGLSGTPFSPGNPQKCQKVPKIGGTRFWGTFSGSSPFSGGLGGSPKAWEMTSKLSTVS